MAEPNPLSAVPRHPVRLVASWSGLSPHVLRAWERRYHAVSPTRSEGGQRLYSDLDVERLRLLHRLTERGHPIGHVARMSLEELGLLVLREDGKSDGATAAQVDGNDEVRAAIRAAERWDATELQMILERAAATMGVPTFLDRVAGPAIHQIGEGWSEGRLCVAHEHLATAVFQRVLGWIGRMFTPGKLSRRIIVATPPRQVHELGAMLVAASAAAEGWDVTYLGANLPVEEIVRAVDQTRAHAVALSIVHPADDVNLPKEIAELRDRLPGTVPLWVGGRGVETHRDRLAGAGIDIIGSLPELRERLRTQAVEAALA